MAQCLRHKNVKLMKKRVQRIQRAQKERQEYHLVVEKKLLMEIQGLNTSSHPT
jgi:hypothetical protein